MFTANHFIRGMAVALAFSSQIAAGAEVGGLYAAEVPVASRSDADRASAIGRALLEVLVKVTGQRDPQDRPQIAAALAGGGKFVQQFQYFNATSTVAEGTNSVQPLRLRARFEQRQIDALARDAGLPVWGRERPALLAWVAVERQGSRALIGADDPSALGATIQQAGARRGVPIELPLLDLEDRGRLRVTDVWGGFDDRVRAASQRYRPDLLLVGRVFASAGQLWEAQWRLLSNGNSQVWSSRAEGLKGLLGQGTVEAIDRVALRFAGQHVVGGPSRFVVILDDIQGLRDYARALKYLGSLKAVTRVDVERASGTTMTLSLTSDGGAEGLRRVVALGQILVEQPGVDGLRFRVAH